MISEGLQKFAPENVWYASNILLGDFNTISKRDITTNGPASFSKKCDWAFNLNESHIENINDGVALGKVSKMHRTDVSLKYKGEGIIYFCIHVEDDHLASVSYLDIRSARDWYVYPSQHMNEFERDAIQVYIQSRGLQ